MGSIDGTTLFERKCEVIEKINSLCEFYGISSFKEPNINMSIEELNDILKEIRLFIAPKRQSI